MKIYEYYRDTANINLNGSIASLGPAFMIVALNLAFFNKREVMLLTIPFLIYGFISFQLYLFRLRQSISIKRKMSESKGLNNSLFDARHLLVLFMNTSSSRLLLYFPDGHLAGTIKKFRRDGWYRLSSTKIYALYTSDKEMMGLFEIKGNRKMKINVYDRNRLFLGSFEKKNKGFRKDEKVLLDSTGDVIGAVEGSAVFMDEKVFNPGQQQVGRLRRGWMPLSWGQLFPEPNTPVLTFRDNLSECDKLLRMSLLINEYFIER